MWGGPSLGERPASSRSPKAVPVQPLSLVVRGGLWPKCCWLCPPVASPAPQESE